MSYREQMRKERSWVRRILTGEQYIETQKRPLPEGITKVKLNRRGQVMEFTDTLVGGEERAHTFSQEGDHRTIEEKRRFTGVAGVHVTSPSTRFEILLGFKQYRLERPVDLKSFLADEKISEHLADDLKATLQRKAQRTR